MLAISKREDLLAMLLDQLFATDPQQRMTKWDASSKTANDHHHVGKQSTTSCTHPAPTRDTQLQHTAGAH